MAAKANKKVTKAKSKPASKPVKKPAVKASPKPVAKPAVKKPAPKPVKKSTAKAPAASVPARKFLKTKSLTEPVDLENVKSPFTAKELTVFKELLLKLRDRIVDEISFQNDNLNRSQRESAGDLSSYSFHMADQGTDNFEREFAANLLNNEQDSLYEVDEALRRIDQGTYGICEMSGKPIERERLKVLPFARYSIAVQSEMERGKPRFRPFRRISIQAADATNT